MSLINKSSVKKRTLEVLAEQRPHLVEKMTRVSSQWYDKIERGVDSVIQAGTAELNTSGKTIK
jgi:hypothetical protein